MIDTVSSGDVSRIEIVTDIQVECPYDSITDEYEVRIEFTPGDETPEYSSLSEWFGRMEGAMISQEHLADYIYWYLTGMDLNDVSVSVSGEQYGVDVTVKA